MAISGEIPSSFSSGSGLEYVTIGESIIGTSRQYPLVKEYSASDKTNAA
jgi:hypothetical protein